MVVRQPTEQELRALDSPPAAITEKLDRLLPAILAWYNSVEAELLPTGRRLTEKETQFAREVGVLVPDRVRIVVLKNFPMPSDPALFAETQRYGLGSPTEGGRANGYLIMLKPQFADNFSVISHELVHVAQHDRLGRDPFVRRYLTEMELMGYARSPLELEASEKQK